MEQFDPLQRRRESIQAQQSVLFEKLSELRYRAGYTAGASEKFQLEKDIEQAEEELEELEQQLSALDRTSAAGRLYQALLKLGYTKQVLMFRKFVQRHPIAAFLIYGKVDYGQQWLLNRLIVQHTRDSLTAKTIKVSLSRVARRNDVAALWRELGRQVGLGRQGEVSAIVERVYQWWRTQNVLLIFDDLNFLPETFLQELLQDFWTPLVSQSGQSVRGQDGIDTNYRLLMFLVDYTGCVGDWSVPFAETLDALWRSKIPVKLPILSEFTQVELVNWLNFSADDLPLELVDCVDETVQDILENSDNGIPELTFEEICQRVGLNWYEAEKRWIR